MIETAEIDAEVEVDIPIFPSTYKAVQISYIMAVAPATVRSTSFFKMMAAVPVILPPERSLSPCYNTPAAAPTISDRDPGVSDET